MSIKEIRMSKKPLLGAADNGVVILVALNTFTFIVLNFLRLVFIVSFENAALGETNFNNQILHWFVLHANAHYLLSKPWTIFLYMFTNLSIWTLLSNMLWLWAFGYILQDLAGNKKMLPLYLYGGFVGAVVFLVSINLIPSLQHNVSSNYFLLGGGASVMAIAVATTTLAPNYKILPLINGGIPLWILMVVYAALQFGTLTMASSSVTFAYLASAIIGFLFIQQLNKGKDWGNWMYKFIHWLNDLFNPEKKLKQQEYFYKTNVQPFEKKANLSQEKLDAILDKINKLGYDNLTNEEKEFLNRASKEEL